MSIFNIFKKKSPNNELHAAIKALEKTEILMMPQENASVKHPGASKIGGKPYLPADFEWPTFTSTDDDTTRHLSFFCQINLTEVKPYDNEGMLPDRGTLYFFYECESSRWGFDPDDKGSARVFYFEDTAGFVPFDVPECVDEDYIIPEIALEFKTVKSYPSFYEFEIHSELECEWEDYDEAIAELGVDTEDIEKHKVLGYADVMQDEMLSECERVTRGLYCGDPESYQNTPDEVEADINNKSKEWTLLLQLQTITKDNFMWMYGDCGMLYYYVKKEDMAKHQLDNGWFCVQCG